MKVVEIFESIDGEGKRVGLPTTFIRLHGCNLNCSYCDTRYGCEEKNESGVSNYRVATIDEVVNRCLCSGIPNITITGGEPMIHPGIEQLIETLVNNDCIVNVETNGTKLPHRMKNRDENRRLFYTMDYKCESSGMSKAMNMEAIEALDNNDVLKFVVGSVEDMEQAVNVIDGMKNKYMPEIYFSPVFGKIEPKEIVDFLLRHRMYNCKVQVQLHKIIWEPEMRGV